MAEELIFGVMEKANKELQKAFSGEFEAIRECETNYLSLISKMCSGFALNQIISDADGKPCNCRFLEVNPAFERITRLNAKKIIGKTIEEVFPGNEQFWVEQCGQVAVSGNPTQFKSGSKLFDRYFEVIAYSPQIGQVATIFTDLTQRMKIETALRESEYNFRAISEKAKDGILIIEGADNFAYANAHSSEITGYTNEMLINMSLRDLIHPGEINRVTQIFRSRLAGIHVPNSFETIIIHKNGREIPIDVTDSRMFWKGKPAVMIVIRDITQRKRFEKALGKINDQLELRVQERNAELVATTKKLEEKQKDLMLHKADLEKVNKELVQTNTAISVLARNIDKKKDELEKKIARSIGSQILPLIDEIKTDKIPEKSQAKIDVLAEYVKNLTPNVAKSQDIIISLSSMELRIAMMIRNGFSSNEISRLLHISPHTVKTHRRSIRKKLGITKSKINLATYLKLKLGKVPARAQYKNSIN
jgi:PAS domain S-box-containing protein